MDECVILVDLLKDIILLTGDKWFFNRVLCKELYYKTVNEYKKSIETYPITIQTVCSIGLENQFIFKKEITSGDMKNRWLVDSLVSDKHSGGKFIYTRESIVTANKEKIRLCKNGMSSESEYLFDLEALRSVYTKRYQISGIKDKTKHFVSKYYQKHFRDTDNVLVLTSLHFICPEYSSDINTDNICMSNNDNSLIGTTIRDLYISFVKPNLDKSYL